MKVKELLAELEKCNRDHEVICILDPDTVFKIWQVTGDEDGEPGDPVILALELT